MKKDDKNKQLNWNQFEKDPKEWSPNHPNYDNNSDESLKKKIMITTDDFSSKNFKYFKYWDRLKRIHPELKLTMFTIPMHDGNKKYRINKDPNFTRFCYFNKRVTLGVHGLTHGAPPENLGTYDEQVNLLKIAKQIMTWKVPAMTFAYRCPGFKFNDYTLPALKDTGYTLFFDQDKIIDLSDNSIIKDIKLINTHSNGINDDSIEKIFDWLNKVIGEWKEEYTFINLEDLVKK